MWFQLFELLSFEQQIVLNVRLNNKQQSLGLISSVQTITHSSIDLTNCITLQIEFHHIFSLRTGDFACVSPWVKKIEKKKKEKDSEITLEMSENTDNASFEKATVLQMWYREKTYRGNSINGVVKNIERKSLGSAARRWNIRDECYSNEYSLPPGSSRSVLLSVNYAQLISPRRCRRFAQIRGRLSEK